MRKAASSAEEAKQLARDIALHREVELMDVKEVMGTKNGRRLMWRLIGAGNIFKDCFTGNSETYYRLGRRALALIFYADIMEICPELFWQAQKENWKPEKKEV